MARLLLVESGCLVLPQAASRSAGADPSLVAGGSGCADGCCSDGSLG